MVIIVATITGCDNVGFKNTIPFFSVHSEENVKYFKDFDYFTLKGIEEKKAEYPYVKVIYDSLNECKEIQFYLSSEYRQFKKILRKDGLVYSEYEIHDVEQIDKYMDVYTKNRIVKYHYYMPQSSVSTLHIDICKKGKTGVIEERNYSFENIPKFKLTNDISKLPISKAKYISNNKIYTKNNRLYIESDIKKNVSEMTQCFELDSLSYSWYYHFGYLMKTCPGKNVPLPGDW